jgi:hypothetical protein
MGFEHCRLTLKFSGAIRNAGRDRHNLA